MHFSELGLGPDVLRAIEDVGYTTPTPIQEKAIPWVLQGRDVLGCAQTGTGKTAGFTLPMIEILAQGRAKARMPRSLILEPTRELAAQVAENFDLYGKYHKLNMALLIGGESFGDQVKKLERGVDVLIATPGRMMDLFDRGNILLSDIKILVIDEADRMLDMGFIPDIERIVGLLPKIRQTLFFSATMPPEIKKLADQFLMNPREVSVSAPASTATTVTQGLVVVPFEDKRKALRQLLRHEDVKNAFIFCNRKKEVAILHQSLVKHGFNAGCLHGDLVQSKRTETLEAFKDGKIDLLVCSDVAARGIDIKGVSHVFNFDTPHHSEDYVHRIGRTGRAGLEGKAYTLAAPEDGKLVLAIEKLIGNPIPRLALDGFEAPELEFDDAARRRRGGRPEPRSGSGRRDGRPDRDGRGGERGGERGSERGSERGERPTPRRDSPLEAEPAREVPVAPPRTGPGREESRRHESQRPEPARQPQPPSPRQDGPRQDVPRQDGPRPDASRPDGRRNGRRDEPRRFDQPRFDQTRSEPTRQAEIGGDRFRPDHTPDPRRQNRGPRDDFRRHHYEDGWEDRNPVLGFGDDVPGFMLIRVRPARPDAAPAAPVSTPVIAPAPVPVVVVVPVTVSTLTPIVSEPIAEAAPIAGDIVSDIAGDPAPFVLSNILIVSETVSDQLASVETETTPIGVDSLSPVTAPEDAAPEDAAPVDGAVESVFSPAPVEADLSSQADADVPAQPDLAGVEEPALTVADVDTAGNPEPAAPETSLETSMPEIASPSESTPEADDARRESSPEHGG